MLNAFGLRVCAGYVPVHATTHKINTSQWHHSGVNGHHFVRKQYELSVKSLCISNKSERPASILVATRIKPHGHYTLFLYFSQIANHMFDIHSIGLSSSDSSHSMQISFLARAILLRDTITLKCHVSAGVQVLIACTQHNGKRN